MGGRIEAFDRPPCNRLPGTGGNGSAAARCQYVTIIAVAQSTGCPAARSCAIVRTDVLRLRNLPSSSIVLSSSFAGAGPSLLLSPCPTWFVFPPASLDGGYKRYK